MGPSNDWVKFSKIHKHMKTFLTYKQLYGIQATKKEIIKDIHSIKLTRALRVLCKCSAIGDKGKEEFMNLIKPYLTDDEYMHGVEPFDTMSLLYSIKWFLAYGTESPSQSFGNRNNENFNVIMTVLKIADYLEIVMNKIDNANIENQVLKGWLYNQPGEISNALIRQHVMFGELSKTHEKVVNGQIKVHEWFETEYGYSIQEYVATVFALHQPIVHEVSLQEIIGSQEWGVNQDQFLEKVKIKDKSSLIIENLTTNITTLKKWALAGIDKPYDYELLLLTPLIKVDNVLFPLSIASLNKALFDGLFFKLINCFKKNGEDFFNFFGDLFERYVSLILSEAVLEADYYEYIPEFIFDKNGGKKSSDAYIRQGRSLLIFECKSGRIRKETKVNADPIKTSEDFEKYAIKPFEQANTAYERIIRTGDKRFSGINKAYIFSVSTQSFPKIPRHQKLNGELIGKLNSNIKGIDYIGLTELELMAYIISNSNITVFKFIRDKFRYDYYVPYLNYFSHKYGKAYMTKYMKLKFNESIDIIKKTLFY